jgi:hypothetical protein
MPSSQPIALSAEKMPELVRQLQYLIKDIYANLDKALFLDNKGVMIPLTYGGMGEDVSGFSGLIAILSGAAVVVNASNPIDGNYLPAMSVAKKGGVPPTGTPSDKFLQDDGTWDLPDMSAYQLLSEKDAASGYAGLDAASRVTKGAVTTDDIIIDLATKGVVLKDNQATPHYWRLTNTVGTASFVDIGTSLP